MIELYFQRFADVWVFTRRGSWMALGPPAVRSAFGDGHRQPIPPAAGVM